MSLRDRLKREIGKQLKNTRRRDRQFVVVGARNPFGIKVNKRDIKLFKPSAIKGLIIQDVTEHGQQVIHTVNYNP